MAREMILFANVLEEDAHELGAARLSDIQFGCKLFDCLTMFGKLGQPICRFRALGTNEIVQCGAANLTIHDARALQHREPKHHLFGVIADHFAPRQRHRQIPQIPPSKLLEIVALVENAEIVRTFFTP